MSIGGDPEPDASLHRIRLPWQSWRYAIRAFFNLCRLHGIVCLKERSGTAFALSDSLGGILGLLGIAGTRRGP